MLERFNQLLNFNIMKKSILNLRGAQELSKNEQKSINGGICVSQRLYPNMSQSQCNAVGGLYLGSRGCLVGSCNPPVGPELECDFC